MRTIWPAGETVQILDQTQLPREVVIRQLRTSDEMAHAIRTMQVRGAPLIGAAAAYGLWLAMREDGSDAGLEAACRSLLATRPTAVNLRWALETMSAELGGVRPSERAAAARAAADRIADEDVTLNRAIGEHALGAAASAGRPAPGRRAAERAHPLQRRLAGHRRSRNGAGRGVRRARRRRAGPRLGRRDAPAQPGRRADRLGAARARACRTR